MKNEVTMNHQERTVTLHLEGGDITVTATTFRQLCRNGLRGAMDYYEPPADSYVSSDAVVTVSSFWQVRIHDDIGEHIALVTHMEPHFVWLSLNGDQPAVKYAWGAVTFRKPHSNTRVPQVGETWYAQFPAGVKVVDNKVRILELTPHYARVVYTAVTATPPHKRVSHQISLSHDSIVWLGLAENE